jgi:hypothetical protein
MDLFKRRSWAATILPYCLSCTFANCSKWVCHPFRLRRSSSLLIVNGTSPILGTNLGRMPTHEVTSYILLQNVWTRDRSTPDATVRLSFVAGHARLAQGMRRKERSERQSRQLPAGAPPRPGGFELLEWSLLPVGSHFEMALSIPPVKNVVATTKCESQMSCAPYVTAVRRHPRLPFGRIKMSIRIHVYTNLQNADTVPAKRFAHIMYE